jgi:D-amino-acid dehydrogenase
MTSSNTPGAPAMPPLRDDETASDVLVVGAGIVGLASAFELARAGQRVLLLDRSGIAAEASRGNAGALAFSDILPLASPGIVRQAPRWLLDPLGPLALRPAYLPQIAPWLWRFWRASRADRVAASTQVQAALMRLAAAATRPLLEAAGAADQLRDGGNLHLYESEAAWRASLPGWQVRQAHGVALQHLHDLDAIAALQPGLSAGLVAATFVPHWQTVIDPLQVALHVARAFAASGGRLRVAEAVALQPASDAVRVRLADGRSVHAQHVVLAAGAWSHRLARSLGDRIPLETERGYNTTLPPGAFDLRRQLTFPDHGFVMTPIAGGVRVGGAVELAGLHAPPNFARADALLAKAQRFVPGLRSTGGTQWMGFRPSLPDSLPVIGPAPREPRVIYAFGHGHLGLTQSAATAQLVRELVLRLAPSMDLQPLSAARFN